jgi:hypothetical protein
VYDTWDYWVSGLCPSSGIIKNTTIRKLDLFQSVLITGPVTRIIISLYFDIDLNLKLLNNENNKLTNYTGLWSRDGAVGIATGYGLDGRGIGI